MTRTAIACSSLLLLLGGCASDPEGSLEALPADLQQKVEFYYTPTVDPQAVAERILSATEPGVASETVNLNRIIAALHRGRVLAEPDLQAEADPASVEAIADALLSGLSPLHVETLWQNAPSDKRVEIIDRASTRMIEGAGDSETIFWLVAGEYHLSIPKV